MKLLSEARRSNSQKGAGLVAAIFLTTLFTSLIAIMAAFTSSNSKMNALVASEEKAFAIAESGMDFAIRRSLDTGNWNWVRTGNFAGGQVRVRVRALAVDTVGITSVGQLGVTAKRISLLTELRDLIGYSIYTSGNNFGVVGGDPPQNFWFNAEVLPLLDIDTLITVAQAQGRYYANNHTLNNGSPSTNFWSNPADQSQDANVYYIGGNLKIQKKNGPVGGIFVVRGNVTMRFAGTVNGIIFTCNETGLSMVNCTANNAKRTIQGGIVGNTDIQATSAGFGPRLKVFLNAGYLTKFYTYSLNRNSLLLKKLKWIANY